VSARETIENLWDRATPVAPLLDAFAHELAEKIRNSEELRDFTDDHMSDCNAAADLIDPEVN
jgi:hypothetical protein